MSQLVDVAFVRSAHTWPNMVVVADQSQIQAVNGPDRMVNIMRLNHANRPVPGWDDMSGSDVADGNGTYSPRSWGWFDDDGSELPTSYNLIKEGIERFFITDINNPAASSSAQSELVVMYDYWASSLSMIPSGGEVARYNHVPGGSNVLYMDGHVEFIRYGTEYPLFIPDASTGALASAMDEWITFMGGMGK
jgi:prepilin-type processing-associated H-X9-DG protein